MRAQPQEADPSRSERLRAIRVVIGATVGMALGFGSLSLLSVFMRPLEADLGWSRAEVSLAYAIAAAGMALGGLVWGWVSDRADIRILLAIGSSGLALPLFAMAAVQSPWQAYVAHLVLGALGFAVLYAPLLAATGDWFDRRRGLAVGIVTAGGALGQGVLPFLANVLIDGVGWRLAFVILAVAVATALAMTLPYVTRPQGARPETGAATRGIERGFEAGRLRLNVLALAAFLCCTCMGVPLMHVASFVGMVCGSPTLGATSLLVAMLAGTVGRVWFGFLADRVGYLPSYALASAIQTISVAAYPLLGDSVSFLALSAVFGFGFSGNMTSLVLCVRELVPHSRFGSSIGLVMMVAWAGMGLGGYAGGALFDATLSYASSFALAALAGVLNLAIIAALAVMPRSAGGPQAAAAAPLT